MPHFLLGLSLGPIQPFIGAARRTRDLFVGSQILSELSKGAAETVQQHPSARLIFPAPPEGSALVASLENILDGGSLNVANVILAEFEGEAAACRSLAADAKAHVNELWRAFRADAIDRVGSWRTIPDLIAEQADVVEVYAAWVPTTPQTYPADRRTLMRLLGARKALRDFAAGPPRPGHPKSSLDGARESVLLPAEEVKTLQKDRPRGDARLRLAPGEQLDSVGLTKRAVGGNQDIRYPSVSRIAADPFLEGTDPEALRRFAAACKAVRQAVRGLHEIHAAAYPQYATFPYEGSVVYEERHRPMFEEDELDPDDPAAGHEAMTTLRTAHRTLLAAQPPHRRTPNPYLAVLVADGDHMGAAISALETPDEHREFSRTLAGFAGRAKEIVAKHRGVLVYAGGDDVFAFLPADTAIACARELRDDFVARMAPVHATCQDKTPGTPVAPMTLSVGIAIGHFLENLEDLRLFGLRAEKHAKGDGTDTPRDALAVHLVKRGGSPLKIRGNWQRRTTDDTPVGRAWTPVDERLHDWTDLYRREKIADRAAFQLRALANQYHHWSDPAARDQALRAEAARLILRKEAGAADEPEEGEASGAARQVVDRLLGAIGRERTRLDVHGLAAELVIARELARIVDQRRGRLLGPRPAGTGA